MEKDKKRTLRRKGWKFKNNPQGLDKETLSFVTDCYGESAVYNEKGVFVK